MDILAKEKEKVRFKNIPGESLSSSLKVVLKLPWPELPPFTRNLGACDTRFFYHGLKLKNSI
jgi:hypothetical protein